MPSKPTGTPSTGKHEEWLRVGRQLSFALYGASNRIIRLHRPFLEPLGLTYPQFLVMLALYEDAPRSVGDLGLVLGMETGTLTPLLKRLQTAGLLTRTRDSADERRVLIDLTDAGRALREEACSVPAKIETACRLSNDQLAELRDTLDGLARPRGGEPEPTPTNEPIGESS
jgi:MarR family transcriptional regulator, organic hydroperoxide resistance regulator